MKAPRLLRIAIAITSGTVAAAWAAPSYSRDIRPLIQKQCQGCHQPASKMAGLDLTTFTAFRAGGRAGSPFVAGKPEVSLVVQYITGEKQPRMPVGGTALANEQVDLFREWIAAGAVDDSAAETNDVSSAGPSEYVQLPVITALAFSPDSQWLAVSGNREMILHSADGSKLPVRLPGQAERILSIAFTKDGTTLVAGGGTPAKFGEVQVWDVASQKLRRSARVTEDTVFGASVSPDGKVIAVGGADNSIRVLEAASGKEIHKVASHENWVLGTVFDVAGKRFVSVGKDRAAKLVDSASGAFLENVNLLRGELTAVARHPSKDLIVIGGEERYPYIYMLDRPKIMRIADDTTLVRKLERQNGAIVALAWSPDGNRIAVAGAAPEVNIYDANTGERVAQCKGHSAGIYALSFSPDSRTLATGGFDGMVRLYEMPTGKLGRSFAPVPLSKAFSPTERTR